MGQRRREGGAATQQLLSPAPALGRLGSPSVPIHGLAGGRRSSSEQKHRPGCQLPWVWPPRLQARAGDSSNYHQAIQGRAGVGRGLRGGEAESTGACSALWGAHRTLLPLCGPHGLPLGPAPPPGASHLPAPGSGSDASRKPSGISLPPDFPSSLKLVTGSPPSSSPKGEGTHVPSNGLVPVPLGAQFIF